MFKHAFKAFYFRLPFSRSPFSPSINETAISVTVLAYPGSILTPVFGEAIIGRQFTFTHPAM
jgi:hypothetical protein